MNLLLNPTNSINDLNEEFMKNYPHLKFRFFNHSHETGEGSMAKDEISADTLLGEIGLKTETQHHIQGNSKVKNLEDWMQNQFDAGVQIFRKSGDVWLLTTTTDEWTLHHQEENAY
jgi:hypothetical protein